MAIKDGPDKLIGSILVLCTQNAVRSPMLEAMLKYVFGACVFVQSAGVEGSQVNPFAVNVMGEVSLDISDHNSVSYHDITPNSYDLIIALSRPAYELAKKIACDQALEIEYWTMPEPPTAMQGNREQMLDNFRRIRDDLKLHLENRFQIALQMEHDKTKT